MSEIKYDNIGPSKVLHLYSPELNLKAILVIDNTVLGPAIGGVRVSPSVCLPEVIRLARTMTLKNSIAGIPHGGGKAGIIADPGSPLKDDYFRAFAKMTKDLTEYIPGPDMGSNEESMALIHEETGRAVGLPERFGGLPLDKLGATGFGLAQCAEVAAPYAGIELSGAGVAIHGYGSVGKAAARFLSEKGAVIVAVSDRGGCISNPDGIDPDELLKVKGHTGSVVNYSDGKAMDSADIFTLPCDILLPAATPDVINSENVEGIEARLILQGANIPATTEAEERLYERGILSIPDFIANAGGVIMAAMEYAGKSEDYTFMEISERLKSNTAIIVERAREKNIRPGIAAEEIARERILGTK